MAFGCLFSCENPAASLITALRWKKITKRNAPMTCGHLSMEWGLCAGGWRLRVGGSRRPVGALAAASGVVAGLVVAGPAGSSTSFVFYTAKKLICRAHAELGVNAFNFLLIQKNRQPKRMLNHYKSEAIFRHLIINDHGNALLITNVFCFIDAEKCGHSNSPIFFSSSKISNSYFEGRSRLLL